MTPLQQQQHDRIKAAQAELRAALDAHEHSLSEAGCAVCGTSLTWDCPESPDGYCHYVTEWGSDTKVLLRDGTTVELSEPTPRQYQTEDACLFCGEPDERK